MKLYRPVIASSSLRSRTGCAKQSQFLDLRLPRRYAPRNDIYVFFILLPDLKI